MHKASIWTTEIGNTIEDVAPKIVVIPLFDDTTVRSQGQLAAAKDRMTRKFTEDHLHLPFEENDIPVLSNGVYVHVQLFAAVCQAVAERLEFCYPFDALDAILKDDLVIVIGENM